MMIKHKYKANHLIQSCVYDHCHGEHNRNDQTNHIVQDCAFAAVFSVDVKVELKCGK